MHKTRNLFGAKMVQKGFRVSDFALFLCANCSVQRQSYYKQRNRLIMQTTKNRKFPLGNSLLYISLSYMDFSGCVLFGGAPCFFTMLHRFPHEASGIRHQHGSGSDAAHSGIVPVFCAGLPYKHARRQYHFPAYFPIFAV